MFLKIDPKASLPIYVQIIDQVKLQVASGRLRTGDRIPTVRELASGLSINPNTVAKAYRDLEREGVLEGRPGQGSFISSRSPGLSHQRKAQIVSKSMETPLVQAYHLMLKEQDVRIIFDKKVNEIYRSEEPGKGGSHE
jgi:GntR family transcriptional regulator